MVGGFSFCGIDVGTIGLQYAPDNANTYVYKPAQTTIQEEAFDGHNGGFYYGVTRKPKDFTLRCYYESQNINDGIMTKIHSLFKVGKSGQQVFERNPWLYYNATVTSVDTSQMQNFLNGCIVVKMRAYYPFARTDLNYIDSLILNDYSQRNNSALQETEEVMPTVEITGNGNLTEQTSFLLYNAGTERASVAIQIAGSAQGVTIANATTGQSCKFVGLSTESNQYVLSDGINGKTVFVNTDTNEKEQAFRFHDYGFIDLEPAFPIVRDFGVSYESGSNILTTNLETQEDYAGKYILVANEWRKIINVSGNQITQSSVMNSTGKENTVIVTMNELTVTPDTTMDLSLLKFVYKHTFA